MAEGSTWYKESELKSCLGLEEKRVPTDEEPTITVDTDTSGDQQQDGNAGDQNQNTGDGVTGPSDSTKKPTATDQPKTIRQDRLGHDCSGRGRGGADRRRRHVGVRQARQAALTVI